MPTEVHPTPPSAQSSPAAAIIELRGITKRFPGVVANRDIDLVVRAGEVHALVGENGAGKSTLMKVLYGMYHPEEGQILVNGTPTPFRGPNDAIAAGVGMVHQHFMLADNFTVLENIILGSEPQSRGRLDIDAARSRIDQISRDYGLDLDPDALVENLTVADRQRVEIAKVLFRSARVLILDEPTAVLVPQEVDELFEHLQEMTAEGLAIVFISHKLDEVLKVADVITVIRRGTTVASVDPGSVTARQLAELMVGSELPKPDTRESTVTDHEQLHVTGLALAAPSGKPILDDISFVVHRGEVAGFAGVEGNGQSELVAALLGLVKPDSGTISVDGRDISNETTMGRRNAGIAVVPEDRHRQALLLASPLWENRLLGHTHDPRLFTSWGWLKKGATVSDTVRIMADYDVRAPGPETLVGSLSGGNQQKLIIGRELESDPSILIAAHPTRGVDVGAQAAIWDRIRAARAKGLATVLISADLEELIGLSDVLYVIYKGRLVAKLDPADVTPQILGTYMTGAANKEASA